MKLPLSRNKRLVLRSHLDRVSSAIHHKFDEASGLMFTEKTISAVSNEERNWSRPLHMTPKGAKRAATPQPAQGTRSLFNSALEEVVENLMNVSLEWIERLPTRFALQIWNLASER